MNEQDKQLLFKDLCARLPYNVIIHINHLSSEEYDSYLYEQHLIKFQAHEIRIKPYLRPLSSMTDDERKELKSILREKDFGVDVHEELCIYTDPEYDCEYYFSDFYEVQDWLNAHHFDYRGLIPKGLALPSPEEMYDFKTE